MVSRPYFIINPKSAGGETGRLWDLSLRKQVVERFPTARWAFTAAAGQGSQLAQQAWREGAELVVAVGGDGTVNEVVNGLMGNMLGDPTVGLPGSQGHAWEKAPAEVPRPGLAVIPRGTGCDFARSVAMPKDFRQALDAIKASELVLSDLGELSCLAHHGGDLRRYFINIAGCGANGEVVQRVNNSGKSLGGFLSFFTASVATTWRYHTPRVELSIDGGAPRPLDLQVLFVCNAQYCGAGMWISKEAYLDDGILQVVEIEKTSRMSSLLNGSKLYTGGIQDVPGVKIYQARELKLTTLEEVLVDCDGEQPGRGPVTFRVLPGALNVHVGPRALAVRPKNPRA